MFQMHTFTDTIQQAIIMKKELLLKIRYSTSDVYLDVFMCPYLFGEDCLMYEFVWGYLPEHDTFYKVITTEVVSAEIVEVPFEVIPNACYLYASSDGITDYVDGFENIFLKSNF